MLTIYKQAPALGEQSRMKAEVTRNGYRAYGLRRETGQWIEIERVSGCRDQKHAIELAKSALENFSGNAEYFGWIV